MALYQKLWPEHQKVTKQYVISEMTNDTIRTAVTNLAESQYGHISTWDVSRVTNMSKLFKDKEDFNEDISYWNVSNVTDMSDMFFNAYLFQSAS